VGGGLSQHRPECKGELGRPWVRLQQFLAGLHRFLQTRGCANQMPLQRPTTILFTEFVFIVDGIRRFSRF